MSKTHYQRNLPHWQPAESTFFITYRLAGSVPKEIIRQFQAEKAAEDRLLRDSPSLSKQALADRLYDSQKRHFGRFDQWLDNSSNEPYWLRQPEIAEITASALRFFDEKFYLLWNYCIMPNHVHLILTTLPGCPELFKVLQRVKSFSGRQSNKVLDRSGAFWAAESYDHIVRDWPEFTRIERYVIENPKKAGLVGSWEEWPFTYIRPE